MKQSTYSESIWMFSRRSQSDNLVLVLPVVKKIDQAAEVNSRKDNRKNCWIINRINSYCRKAAVSGTAGTASNQSNSRRVKSNRLGCTTTHQLGGNGIKNPPARKQSPAWNKLPTRQVTGICHSCNLNTSLENSELTSSDQLSITSCIIQ